MINNNICFCNFSPIIGDDSASNVDDDEEPSPSCGDYIMHFLTLIWKIIFAFIPPTGKKVFIV